MNPNYPLYIVSKSRWESRLTSKALERMDVPYYIVVEAHQYNEYASVIDKNKILILPQEFLDNYDTCDELGNTKSKGPGAARNFAWEHSIKNGFKRHWVLDDNIPLFYRLNRNTRIIVNTGSIFKAAEDFVDRYENLLVSGFNYRFFCKQTEPLPPYYLNTRVYSCLLIQNDAPYRWRGRYNEDTDLSLRVLKDGHCTLQFNAFLQGKVATQTVAGGNTEEFYKNEGTINKSKMQVDLHPDVSKLVWKFGRWHHHVDYSSFQKNNKLIKKKNLNIEDKINNYGMKLVDIKDKNIDKTNIS
jgi:hypothetical protein